MPSFAAGLSPAENSNPPSRHRKMNRRYPRVRTAIETTHRMNRGVSANWCAESVHTPHSSHFSLETAESRKSRLFALSSILWRGITRKRRRFACFMSGFRASFGSVLSVAPDCEPSSGHLIRIMPARNKTARLSIAAHIFPGVPCNLIHFPAAAERHCARTRERGSVTMIRIWEETCPI